MLLPLRSTNVPPPCCLRAWHRMVALQRQFKSQIHYTAAVFVCMGTVYRVGHFEMRNVYSIKRKQGHHVVTFGNTASLPLTPRTEHARKVQWPTYQTWTPCSHFSLVLWQGAEAWAGFELQAPGFQGMCANRLDNWSIVTLPSTDTRYLKM